MIYSNLVEKLNFGFFGSHLDLNILLMYWKSILKDDTAVQSVVSSSLSSSSLVVWGLLFVFCWVGYACFLEGFFAIHAGFASSAVLGAVTVTRPRQLEGNT